MFVIVCTFLHQIIMMVKLLYGLPLFSFLYLGRRIFDPNTKKKKRPNNARLCIVV